MAFNFTYNYPQVARESGFKLRNYKDGPLDWRLVGSMEIERILKDQSFEQIDGVLHHLSEVPLGSILDSNILDSGISKYFMLSQFSVQYLIFCRQFLEETVTDLRESHGVSQMEIATLKRNLSEANNEILQLHKKITQMEAIHEVIYPCHLCTKNFVSNDALNLHISRKHNEYSAKSSKKSEIPQPVCKERENDLSLIKTIKLELEIKQLKERLNNAEREIKDKNFESDIKTVPEVVSSVSHKPEIKSVHSIGIQSNLCEIKETDDVSTSSFNAQQLSILQEKLQDFEKWKEEQKLENSEFLSVINNKLQVIGNSLELTRNQQIDQIDTVKQKSSVEELETLLNKKVEEIGKALAANLEDTVGKMEINYKDKIHQLENELDKLNKQYIKEKDFKTIGDPLKIGSDSTNIQYKNETFKIVEVNEKTLDCLSNTEDLIGRDKRQHPLKEASASESNHTFVKCSNVTHLERSAENNNHAVSNSSLSDEDSTDISASLLEDENIENVCNEPIKINNNPTNVLKEKNSHLHNKQQARQKVFSKTEATKIANDYLSSLGVDIKTKTLTPLLKKKYLGDLTERRNKLKQKHPQFHLIRSQMKKFVDKLCSTKMPPNAKALLKETNHVRPKIKNLRNDFEYSLSEKEGNSSLKASTPLSETPSTDGDNFKQRLDRILASPIRKPDDYRITAIVHREESDKNPVPMPRKRVMFNYPEVQVRRSNNFLNLSDNDEPELIEPNPEQTIKK